MPLRRAVRPLYSPARARGRRCSCPAAAALLLPTVLPSVRFLALPAAQPLARNARRQRRLPHPQRPRKRKRRRDPVLACLFNIIEKLTDSQPLLLEYERTHPEFLNQAEPARATSAETKNDLPRQSPGNTAKSNQDDTPREPEIPGDPGRPAETGNELDLATAPLSLIARATSNLALKQIADLLGSIDLSKAFPLLPNPPPPS